MQSDGRPLELEILLSPRPDGANFAKQIKINGAPRRRLDLVGLMRAVLFLPEDIRLVDGAPGERRRYLDIALCQIDRGYCRALSAYQQVVTQRNSLLRNLRDQGANPHSPAVDAQLAFWDERLVQHGAAGCRPAPGTFSSNSSGRQRPATPNSAAGVRHWRCSICPASTPATWPNTNTSSCVRGCRPQRRVSRWSWRQLPPPISASWRPARPRDPVGDHDVRTPPR